MYNNSLSTSTAKCLSSREQLVYSYTVDCQSQNGRREYYVYCPDVLQWIMSERHCSDHCINGYKSPTPTTLFLGIGVNIIETSSYIIHGKTTTNHIKQSSYQIFTTTALAMYLPYS